MGFDQPLGYGSKHEPLIHLSACNYYLITVRNESDRADFEAFFRGL
jgi:hypothetical protein